MPSPTVDYAQSPIAPGNDRCLRLLDGASVGREATTPPITDGFSVVVDTQPEAYGRHPVVRIAHEGRALGFDLIRNLSGIQLEAFSEEGDRAYSGRVALSSAVGKRLMVRYDLAKRSVAVAELQPWATPHVAGSTQLSPAQPMIRNWKGLRLGGESGEEPGQSYRGKVAEFAVFDRRLPDSRLPVYRAESKLQRRVDGPEFDEGALDSEGIDLLVDTYRELEKMQLAGSLTSSELRNAASIAFLWTLDRRPLLQRASDRFGVLLRLPDLKRSEALDHSVRQAKPGLWLPDHDPSGNWMALRGFNSDLACWLGAIDHEVSWEAFIKFVRNKLGAGHYDPSDRRRWQVELDALARQTQVNGVPWMASTMLILVHSLLHAVQSTGIISLARELQRS